MTKRERADAVYKALTGFIDRNDLKCSKDENDRTIVLSVQGEELVINALFKIDEQAEQIIIYSRLPFEIVKENTVNMIMGCNYINSKLSIGSFCVHTNDNICTYQSTESFLGLSGFNDEYASDIVLVVFGIIERFDEKLAALNKGSITLQDFAARI